MKRYYHKIGERKLQDLTPWDKIFERGKQRKPLVTLWMRHEKPKKRERERDRVIAHTIIEKRKKPHSSEMREEGHLLNRDDREELECNSHVYECHHS